MSPDTAIERGTLVQLSPDTCRNPMLAACFMVVTEPKSFGAQGYVQCTGKDGKAGGQAYYRAQWDEMEVVGRAEWVAA
jgi:hypothetical protein